MLADKSRVQKFFHRLTKETQDAPEGKSLNAAQSPASKDKEEAHPWDETIRTVVFAILLALVFRSLAFEPFHIPSSSMKDTLLIGDYVFVSKYSYGYSRYSFPYGFPLFEGRIASDNRPQRGDIVVFRLPSNPRIDFIKRVIGMPGDKIQVIDSELYINGDLVPREMDSIYYDEEMDKKIPRYKEHLPGGVTHSVLDMGVMPPDMLTKFSADNTGVYTVPEKHYFMMGDNRDNSTDSRFTDIVGFVPEENLVGRAEMIFFSMEPDADYWEFWKWPTSLRWDRFFKMLGN